MAPKWSLISQGQRYAIYTIIVPRVPVRCSSVSRFPDNEAFRFAIGYNVKFTI